MDNRVMLISWSDEGSKDYVSRFPLVDERVLRLARRLTVVGDIAGAMEDLIAVIMSDPPVQDINPDDIILHSVIIAKNVELTVT